MQSRSCPCIHRTPMHGPHHVRRTGCSHPPRDQTRRRQAPRQGQMAAARRQYLGKQQIQRRVHHHHRQHLRPIQILLPLRPLSAFSERRAYLCLSALFLTPIGPPIITAAGAGKILEFAGKRKAKCGRVKREQRMALTEPYAYAKIATRGDVLPPFYLTEEHVKDRDHTGAPTRIEIVLGR